MEEAAGQGKQGSDKSEESVAKPKEDRQSAGTHEPDVLRSPERVVPPYKIRRLEEEARKLKAKSVEAATEAAVASRRSARWSVWAVVVAVVALAVAVWQNYPRQ